ncbi:MAG: hypothetical protein DME69_13390 [Verrucomicrobia bacterium]|nr:MAG: hypothetical protein DME69_13390 [Verrucomicrobiota bacterium]
MKRTADDPPSRPSYGGQGADFTDQVRRQTQKETKTAKILADCLEFFTEGNEGKEGGLHPKERKFKLRFPRGLL